MRHLKRFLIFFLLCFILIVIANGAGFLRPDTFSLLESLEDPWTYFGSLMGALFLSIYLRNDPF